MEPSSQPSLPEIQRLLSRFDKNDLAQDALARISHGTDIGTVGSAVERKHLLGTMTIRNKINAARGNGILGFPELLTALSDSANETVQIVSITDHEYTYMLFLRAKDNESTGLLRIPKTIARPWAAEG
jgi:hypothetical protein